MAVELSDHGQEAVAQLRAALEATDAAGAPLHPDDVTGDALAVLVLATAPLDELDVVEEALLARFAARIGLEPGHGGAELARLIDQHFQQSPLPAGLSSSMNAVLRALVKGHNGEAAAAALGAATGGVSKVPVGQREGADGSTRMGVMGRFALQVPPKK